MKYLLHLVFISLGISFLIPAIDSYIRVNEFNKKSNEYQSKSEERRIAEENAREKVLWTYILENIDDIIDSSKSEIGMMTININSVDDKVTVTHHDYKEKDRMIEVSETLE